MSRLAEIRVADGLIRSAREGDDAALARLYAVLAPATFGLIRRLVGARAVAEDLFQETLMIVFDRLDSFRGEAPLGAWVRQIAVSRCLMYLRSPWHRARLDVGAWIDDPAGLDLPAAAAPSCDSIDVERALANLSATARAVVWLYEVEGYSHREIAAAFGRTASFSKSQLSRAHRRLRACLEPRGEVERCAPI